MHYPKHQKLMYKRRVMLPFFAYTDAYTVLYMRHGVLMTHSNVLSFGKQVHTAFQMSLDSIFYPHLCTNRQTKVNAKIMF